MSRERERLTDIACEIKGETPAAYRIFDGARTEWVPKSQCENNGDGTSPCPSGWRARRGFI